MSEPVAPPWRRMIHPLHLAACFLTRVPLPDPGLPGPAGLAPAMAVFPLVGAAIGAIGAVVLLALWGGVSPALAALLAILATVIVTGALHEDGLADSADGLGARGGRERRLEVMRDSRNGTFGVLALIASVGLRTLALAALPGPGAAALALVAAAALSRAMMPALMQVLPPARADGLGAGAGQPHAGIAATALALGVVVAIAALGPAAPWAVLAAMLGTALVGVLARHCLGGFTGDILGATQQTAEVTMLIVLAARGGGWLP